jgi:hypothetical protein
MSTCAVCGSELSQPETGGRRVYCSVTCRRRAERHKAKVKRINRFRALVGDVADRQEVLELLWAAAKDGSVLAAKTLLEELRRDPESPGEPSIIDELAAKRKRRR